MREDHFPEQSPAQKLSSEVPALHLHQPRDRAKPLLLLFSKGRKWPHSSPGEEQHFDRTNTRALTVASENKAPISTMGGCVWDEEGIPESPHLAARNGPSDQRDSHLGIASSARWWTFHSSLYAAVKPHFSESPWTFAVVLRVRSPRIHCTKNCNSSCC